MINKTSGKLERLANSVKSTTKNIVDSIKKNAKVYTMLGALAVGGYGANEAKGSIIEIKNRAPPNISQGTFYMNHILEATENFEIIDPYGDATFINNPNRNKIQLYSVNNNCNPHELFTDARGINSTTQVDLELINNGFDGGPYDNFLKFKIVDNTYPNNDLDWKNIFFNINQDKKDIKYLISSQALVDADFKLYGNLSLDILSQSTPIGVYNSGTLEFFNHADLNRDRKVDMQDYAILANEFGKSGARFGANVGSNVNDLGAYTDINRDGSVDSLDLALLTNEWLWNANDPNTW